MLGGGEGTTVEFTPTWVIAAVCTFILGISVTVERLIHFTGEYLKKNNQKPLYKALQKVKEELMLLGFISIMLTVLQDSIIKICVKESVNHRLLPCKLTAEAKSHHRSLGDDYCASKNMEPLLSVQAIHHIHIFIFVLGIFHVTFSVTTVVFGGIQIRKWKQWEESSEDLIAEHIYDTERGTGPRPTLVQQHSFISSRFLGTGKRSAILGWLHSFLKQFHGPVTKSDYITLRFGFIMAHCRGNPKFNFHKYMTRALEDDLKEVVGVSWYLWIYAVIFLLVNIDGWHTCFWVVFVPFILILVVGTKLEHVINELAQEVAEKHFAIVGELVVEPSDDHFWFHRPQIILFLIHIILFQNAFEIGFFFWNWVEYGLDSCIMGQIPYIVARVGIGIFIQVLYSYSTLPLYAIVTQMGSFFKKSIFDEHVQHCIMGWVEGVKRKKHLKEAAPSGPPDAVLAILIEPERCAPQQKTSINSMEIEPESVVQEGSSMLKHLKEANEEAPTNLPTLLELLSISDGDSGLERIRSMKQLKEATEEAGQGSWVNDTCEGSSARSMKELDETDVPVIGIVLESVVHDESLPEKINSSTAVAGEFGSQC